MSRSLINLFSSFGSYRNDDVVFRMHEALTMHIANQHKSLYLI